MNVREKEDPAARSTQPGPMLPHSDGRSETVQALPQCRRFTLVPGRSARDNSLWSPDRTAAMGSDIVAPQRGGGGCGEPRAGRRSRPYPD